MAAVGDDLPVDLVEQDAAAEGRPAAAAGKVGQCQPADIERQCFACQMRVRAEVVREILLEMREVRVESHEEVDEPWAPRRSGGTLVGVREQEMKRPDPGERTEAEFERA